MIKVILTTPGYILNMMLLRVPINSEVKVMEKCVVMTYFNLLLMEKFKFVSAAV
jgi:hypothetical protein